MSGSDRNLTWHAGEVSAADRARALGHGAATVWLTGLSGSGKSTLCRRVERALVERGVGAYVLDGDNVRMGLNADLGFGAKDREENIRRIGEVAKLMTDAGLVVLTAFISPFRADRARVRSIVPAGQFFEVHVATSIEECERRDPKGLYAKARRGEIRDFTGIDSPYEPPDAPELVVGHDGVGADVNAARIVEMLEVRGIVPR
ncbi:adenylyl-sulfate kinase [Sandaracinus amylolyticus]|uniref:adenylyl-sulfate kinase n=1 Tax=Sandaracinus amylolyticus TaxID=927083 RepID=UPI001F012FB4|nr:adenylyl-sulfate kinase [Sandaracinus amylolyticus]UJR80019.1 Adenylyl-sulfate kinase [Sandaracinus amylolyticus]